MPQIIPIKNLKDTSDISEMCHNTNEPIFITKNGYGDMVIMSMETYEERMEISDISKKLAEAEEDIRANRLIDAAEALNNIRKKYNV